MRKFILFLFLPLLLNAQEFVITDTSFSVYSIDRYTNDLYWMKIMEDDWDPYITNLNSLESKISEKFRSVLSIGDRPPIFANKSHKAAYWYGWLYVYDFEEDSLERFESCSDIVTFSFSPNDRYIVSTCVIDLKNNSASKDNFAPLEKTWVSDTSFVMTSSTRIAHYGIFRDPREIIIDHDDVKINEGIDYNLENKILAYTVSRKSPPWDSQLRFYNMATGENTLVVNADDLFGFEPYADSVLNIRDPKWTEDGSKLSFFTETNGKSGIWIYYPEFDSLEQFLAADSLTGYKSNPEWFGKDTLIYFNNSKKVICGFKLDSPIFTNVDEIVSVPENYSIKNYPNPFNPTTTIKFSIPQDSKITLNLYDVLGRKVANLIDDQLYKAGEYSVKWKADNYAGGIYISELRAGSFIITSKMMLLK